MFRGGRLGLVPSLLLAQLLACGLACGRAQGVPDEELGDLVVETRTVEPPIDVARAATTAAELGRALRQPYTKVIAALGPHTLAISSVTSVGEGSATGEDLGERTQLELGEGGAFHGLYTNTADYGREVTSIGGRLYLRPRYQRWHGRAPEGPDEPATLRDGFALPLAATWDLLAPGAELTDKGASQHAGRAARTIAIALAPSPASNPPEKLRQRAWREGRVIEAVSGEIVLDAASGAPLAVQLAGTVAFSRDGKRFRMKLSVTSTVTAPGTAVAIATPDPAEVVATPERLREVDDRDLLLEGIAPPAAKGDAP